MGNPAVALGAEFRKLSGVSGITGDILHFPWVADGIVELFRGAVGVEVERLHGRQGASGLRLAKGLHGLANFLVGDLTRFIYTRCLVPHVAEACLADRAHLVEAFVHVIPERVDILRWIYGRGQEAVAVIFFRHRHTR